MVNKEFVIAAVGDIMLDHPPSQSSAYELLTKANLAVGNLEMVLSSRGYPTAKDVTIRGETILASHLLKMGIQMVSLANNHAMDFGIEGLFDTLDALDQHGIKRAGGGRNLAEAQAPCLFDFGDYRVGMLSFSTTLPLGAEASSDRPGIFPVRVMTSYEINAELLQEQPGTPPFTRSACLPKDLEALDHRIKEARKEADFLIASVHWGLAFQDRLAQYQGPLAHRAVEAGADCVLGHHPHTLHGIEIYRGKPIFYSLGNFIFHHEGATDSPQKYFEIPYRITQQDLQSTRETMIVYLHFENRRISKIQLYPLRIKMDGEPEREVGEKSKTILARLQSLCEPFGVKIEYSEGRGLISL